MATVTNPTAWNLFCQPLRKSVPPKTTITGVAQEVAEEVCRTGIFVLGEDEEEESPRRRARSQRGSVEVEEAVEAERETR